MSHIHVKNFPRTESGFSGDNERDTYVTVAAAPVTQVFKVLFGVRVFTQPS